MPAIHLTEHERAQLEHLCTTLGMVDLAKALGRECLTCRRLTTTTCPHK
jgi:hypothetical protein